MNTPIDLSNLFVEYYGAPSQYEQTREQNDIDLLRLSGWKAPIFSTKKEEKKEKEDPEEPDEEVTVFTPSDDIFTPKSVIKKSNEETNPEFSEAVLNWLNIPYLFGGTTKDKGIDCSSFVLNLYRDLKINLPRTSIELYNAIDRIDFKNLKIGDLVFLKGTQKNRDSNLPSHVAVVTGIDDLKSGKIKVALASKKGTKSSDDKIWDLNNPWYKDHYLGAGRIKG